MGKLLLIFKYVFFVFSADIYENRRHIHITDASGIKDRLCKFWLEPKIELVYNYGFKERELTQIRKCMVENKVLLNVQLDKFYKGEKITIIKK
jgi:hypothetical protein